MDAQDFRSLQEAYLEVYDNELDEGAAGDVAARAQKLANQRKGQTPKRKATYQGLADKAAQRERGPYRRGDTRTGMSQKERDERREADAYHDDVHGDGSSTYGKGGITKNPRKLAQQKARGQHAEEFELWVNSLVEEGYDLSDYTWNEMYGFYLDEQVDIYDIILSHLLDEGYADTQEAAEVVMVNMSENWRQSIINENLVDVAKRGVDVIRNPIGTAVRDIGAAAKGAVKRVTKPYIDASQKEQDMKHPKYNPSTGKIDPNYNPRSSMR